MGKTPTSWEGLVQVKWVDPCWMLVMWVTLGWPASGAVGLTDTFLWMINLCESYCPLMVFLFLNRVLYFLNYKVSQKKLPLSLSWLILKGPGYYKMVPRAHEICSWLLYVHLAMTLCWTCETKRLMKIQEYSENCKHLKKPPTKSMKIEEVKMTIF